MMKRLTAVLMVAILCLACVCGVCAEGAGTKYAGMTAEEITASLTLRQKAEQMLQPACYNIMPIEMIQHDYGSVISKPYCMTAREWRNYIGMFQRAALASDAGIPFVFGQDNIHGVGYCENAVIFPHNIGMGAANDEELMYQVGLITGDEAKLCGQLWNFSPVVAQSGDPRWGRTYESYGADIETITRLSTAYTRGLLDSGIIVCAKHFFGDGNTAMGTSGMEISGVPGLLDRGDARLSEEQIRELLSVYQAQIDTGVQTIMISFSSLNGLKMHENKKYIEMLKNEMGLQGFIVSDWNAVQLNSQDTYYEQIVTSINAGVDMLMEVDTYEEAVDCIIRAVEQGDIPEERVNDAVRRIIRVKLDAGIFDDPYGEKLETAQQATGSGEYRAVAEKLVEESLVLIKNEDGILPLKPGTAVYITGPAADNDQAQCGGWTVDWNSSPEKDIPGVTSILEGFQQKADELGIRVITNSSEADQADVILLVVGEQAYAEWYGDTEDMDLCGKLGLGSNRGAIAKAKTFGKPVVACIVAGRQVLISNYIDSWDGVVMCYLPGSEGQGVANVLCGQAPFTGRLPSPWYSSADQIGTGEAWLPVGYGLTTE